MRTTPVTLARTETDGLRLSDALDVELGDPLGLLDARTVGDAVPDALADLVPRVLTLPLVDRLGDPDMRGDTVPDGETLALRLCEVDTAVDLDTLPDAERDRVPGGETETRADAVTDALVAAEALADALALLRRLFGREPEKHDDCVSRALSVAVGAFVMPVPSADSLSSGLAVSAPLDVAPASAPKRPAPTVTLTDAEKVDVAAALLLQPEDALAD